MKGGSTQMANNQDTFELTSKLIKGVTERENEPVKNDLQLYSNSNIKASISPLYARYIGDTVTVAFKETLKVPGRWHRVCTFTRALQCIDEVSAPC